jgi:spore germination protein GerM
MINRYGIEGYAAQLKQIVYTATGYATVKDVQFLIEGEKREYLGGEGVYIGKPLSRASF